MAPEGSVGSLETPYETKSFQFHEEIVDYKLAHSINPVSSSADNLLIVAIITA